MHWTKLEPDSPNLTFLKGTRDFDKFDSYLLWGDLTYFHQTPVDRDGTSASPIPVIFEANLSDPAKFEALKKVVNISTWSNEAACVTHTGFIKAGDLLAFSTMVQRFRIGSITSPRTKRLGARNTPPIQFNQTQSEDDSNVVVGIIDHGIAFAHKGFCSLNAEGGRTETRIERFWDQQWGYPAAPPQEFYEEQATHFGEEFATFQSNYLWKSVAGFGYGRELTDTSINSLMRTQPDEMRLYKEQRYKPVQSAISHGTHVLGIAAGEGEFHDGVAGTKIIAVQMPASPYKNTSGESLCVHVLDAIRYILHHARGRKVVINLSDGAYAGPHDGTSMLESALDAHFSPNNERLAFVVAAGNQFDERVHWQESIPMNETRHVDWQLLPDDKTDSHVEIWFDEPMSDETLKAISVAVTLPNGAESVPIGIGETAICESADQVVACTKFRGSAVNSQGRAMIHIAVAPTTGHQMHHGICRIALTNDSQTEISFNAYVERDNPALGDRGPRRQSHFVHPKYPKSGVSQHPCVDDSDNPSPIKRMGALNSIATAGKILVVGGYVKKTGQIASYSASGGGRAAGARSSGTDVLAPSDSSPAIKGVRSFGNRSGTTFRMNGTSVATPSATREIATLMRLSPTMVAVFNALSLQASNLNPTLVPSARVGVGRIP